MFEEPEEPVEPMAPEFTEDTEPGVPVVEVGPAAIPPPAEVPGLPPAPPLPVAKSRRGLPQAKASTTGPKRANRHARGFMAEAVPRLTPESKPVAFNWLANGHPPCSQRRALIA